MSGHNFFLSNPQQPKYENRFLGIPWTYFDHSQSNDQPTIIQRIIFIDKTLVEGLKYPLFKCSVLFDQIIKLISPKMEDFCQSSWNYLGRSLNWPKRRSYIPRDVGSSPTRSMLAFFFWNCHTLIQFMGYELEVIFLDEMCGRVRDGKHRSFPKYDST